ncbi:MAG: type II toxin-antitoxin system VapC family toxin [Micropepsaceae bacterium]
MLVVDASVATKWIVAESGSDKARVLLSGDEDLRAPLLLLIEVHYTLAKRFNRREIHFNQFANAAHFLRTVVALHPLDEQAVFAAWQISILGRAAPGASLPPADWHAFSIYDSLYIATALNLNAPLITADNAQADAAERFGVKVRRL